MVGVIDKFNFFYFYIFYFSLNVVKLFCINTNSFLMSFWQKHNTMNLLFMLFFYFFFHPHIYYRAFLFLSSPSPKISLKNPTSNSFEKTFFKMIMTTGPIKNPLTPKTLKPEYIEISVIKG